MIVTAKEWRMRRDQAGILANRIYIIHRVAPDLEEEAWRIYKKRKKGEISFEEALDTLLTRREARSIAPSNLVKLFPFPRLPISASISSAMYLSSSLRTHNSLSTLIQLDPSSFIDLVKVLVNRGLLRAGSVYAGW